MKSLYLIRHAKSSWDDPKLVDIQRPLNSRGLKDAPEMGKRLKDKKIEPELIITSPAKRAFNTAEIIAQVLGYPLENIYTDDRLYQEGVGAMMDSIQSLSEKISLVFLFGHNPDITALAHHLTLNQVHNIPTCGIFSMNFTYNSWSEISRGSGKLVFFDFPNKY